MPLARLQRLCLCILFARIIAEIDVVKLKFYDKKQCGYVQSDSWLASSPWLAEIRAIEDVTQIEFTKCAATIINAKYVLTTARCLLPDKEVALLALHLGIPYKENFTFGTPLSTEILRDYYNKEEIIVHPLYNSTTGENDIAMVKLKRLVQYTQFIQPICLPSPERTLAAPCDTLFRSTWGLPFFSSLPRSRDDIPTKLITNSRCSKIFQLKGVDKYARSTEMCTDEFANATELMCNSLSGASLVFQNRQQYHLEGIMVRPPDCKRQTPGVYVRISKYVDWIENNTNSYYDECLTPDHAEGLCVPLADCPALTDAFANPRKGAEEYWFKYICSTDILSGFQVCCPTSSSVDIEEAETRFLDAPATKPKRKLSDKRFCGQQHRDDYISSDTSIAIDEFPWLATIRAYNPIAKKEISLCSGSLINNRYVLASAYCVSYTDVQFVSIRLGEYHIDNETDCVTIENLNAKDCSVVENLGVEKLTVHPFFNYWTFSNDLALMKLNKTVAFTDYIRPICLPIPELTFVKTGDILYTTSFSPPTLGLGYVGPLKKKLAYELQTNEDCNTKRPVSDYIYCLKANASSSAEFTCFSDDGAPAMIALRNRWTLEGITTDRLAVCDVGQSVTVTRISKYIKWFQENIEL